ncbi:MAG TPA: hypothetical protein VHU13_00330 [Solirubrobacteraceae bacterium]|jgi:cytochrome P450|nr:hypothetical protein [Solirubrobacteraceae bacterium]
MATAVAQQRPGPGGAADAQPQVPLVADDLPRGPRLPPMAQTLLWALAPTWLLDQCARRYGEEFTLTFGPSGRRLVLISDPDAVKTLFTTPPQIAPSAAADSPIARRSWGSTR